MEKFTHKTKAEIMRKVAKETGLTIGTVRDVLNSFTDACFEQIVVNGSLRWPGLPYVDTHVLKGKKIYRPKEDCTIQLDIEYLKANLPPKMREIYKNTRQGRLALEHHLEPNEWYKAFIISQGDTTKNKSE